MRTIKSKQMIRKQAILLCLTENSNLSFEVHLVRFHLRNKVWNAFRADRNRLINQRIRMTAFPLC